MLTKLIELVSGRDYRPFANESALQQQVEGRLTDAGVAFVQQVVLDTPRDRIDLLCGSIGIELKVKGSCSAVLAQLERYAQSTRVQEIVLVTTKAAHLKLRSVGQVHGKSLYVVHVGCI